MFLSPYFTTLCLFLCNVGGNILDFFENIAQELKKYEIINYIICNSAIFYNDYYSYVNNLLVEPKDDFLRSAMLIKDNELELDYHNIEEFTTHNNKITKLINKQNSSLITYKFSDNDTEYISSIITNSKKLNPLFLDVNNTNNFDLKQYIHHFNKVYKPGMLRSVNKNEIKPFLAIQYSHPKQSDKITISLEQKYYAPHNDILDSIFIKIYLSKTYNKNDYIFDDDYEILIIDNSANFHTLKSNQYIHFDYKDWVINEK